MKMISSKKIKKAFFLILTVLFLGIGVSYAKEIEITNPPDATVVAPGDNVTINFIISSKDFKKVFIVMPERCEEISPSPNTYNIQIPDRLGSYPVVIVGQKFSGEFFDDSIKLNVKTNASLESISISPEDIYFDYPEDKIQLGVTGYYSDGKTRYITSSEMGITYTSGNVSVAVVDKEGIVTAKGVGKCSITVSNNSKSINIPVTVFESKTIQAGIKLSPDILYTLRPNQILSCYIELPQQYNIQDINPESILLNYRGKGDLGTVAYGDYNQNGIPDFKIEFPAKEITPFLVPGDQSLVISGLVKEEYFRGVGNIKIIETIRALPFKEFSIEHLQIHWNKEKNEFIINGKLTLPDDYKKNDLEKKANINIGLNKKDGSMFTQETSIDFYKYGHSWFYQNTQNHQSNTDSLIIDKMRVFWQSQFRTGKHAFSNKTAEFFIEGSLIMSKQDKVNLSPNAQLTLNIPIQDITTAGALEGSDTFILDTVPPTGTIKINNNASYVSSTSVTLNLSATDETSGMGNGAQMQFSNDNITWTKSEIYVKAKTWILSSGDGNKTVYAKFKDAVGNWSEQVSASIILDTTAPIITQASTISNSGITFVAKVADAGSGVREVFLYWRKWIWKWGWRWSEWRKERLTLQPDKSYSETLTANQVEHRKIEYYIYAKDKIDNEARTLKYKVKR